MADISEALWITLIGMSLVFAVILLLLVLINILVRFSGDLKQKQSALQEEEAENSYRAAAAAVVIALQLSQLPNELHEFPLPPTATVSPWQAVMRAKILTKRGPQR